MQANDTPRLIRLFRLSPNDISFWAKLLCWLHFNLNSRVAARKGGGEKWEGWQDNWWARQTQNDEWTAGESEKRRCRVQESEKIGNQKQIARDVAKKQLFSWDCFSQLSVIVRIFTPSDKANLVLEFIYIPHRWGLLYIPKRVNGAALLRTPPPQNQKTKKKVICQKANIRFVRRESLLEWHEYLMSCRLPFSPSERTATNIRSPKNATGKSKQRKRAGYPGEFGMGAYCQKREMQW